MASNFLNRKAEERDRIINTKKGSSTKSGGVENNKTKSKASSFLNNKAAERSNMQDRQTYKSPNTYNAPQSKQGYSDNEQQIDALKNELAAKRLKYNDKYWTDVHDEAVSRFRQEGQWDRAKIETRAWETVGELKRAWKKEQDEIEKQIRRLSGIREATWKDATYGALNKGYMQTRLNDESYDYMMGKENDADYFRKRLQGDEYQFEAEGFAKEAVSGALEMLGQQAYMLSKPETLAKVGAATLTGAGTAAIVGQAGPQIALPEELVTVPAGALTGFKAGMGIASAENALRIEAGGAYNEMIESGISHDTAKKLSLAVGTVNAGLEFAQTDTLLKAFKILNKSGATPNIAKRLFDELTERGIDVVKEVGQEVAQEGVSMIGANTANRIDKGENLYTKDEVGERLGDTAKSSFLTFGLMNVPATVTNVALSNPKSNIYQGKTMSDEQQTAEPDALEKAAMEVVENRNVSYDKLHSQEEKAPKSPLNARNNTDRITSLALNLEERTRNNEPITVEEVRKVTGFGKSGAELVADYSNAEGATFDRVTREVKTSYLTGFNQPDLDVNKVKNAFISSAQKEAYRAGQLDRRMQDLEAEIRAKNARVFGNESGVVRNEQSKQYTQEQLRVADTIGKDFGTQISFEERLIANYETGAEANAWHRDGEIKRSNTSDNKFMEDILEESFHRMIEMNTKEAQTLMSFAYEFAEELGRSDSLGVNTGLLFDKEKALHDNAGITLDTRGYTEEVAAGVVAKNLFKNEKDYIKWREKLDTNSDLRNAWQKLMDIVSEIIEKIRRLLEERSFSKETREKVNKELTDMERMKSLYTDAYIATRDAVAERTKQVQNDKTQNNDYSKNGANFSLKNKNLTIDSRITYVKLRDYIKVEKNDYTSLNKLESKVKNINRGTYQNDATGYSANITSDTIRKAINPTHNKFNPFEEDHIRNLNAMVKLPELFKNAVYIDSKNPQKGKDKNPSYKEYHHFVSPIFMDNNEYRALITAREKVNSNTLYVLSVEVLPTQKRHTPSAAQHNNAVGSQLLNVPLDISISELMNGVKIYNYDTKKSDVYSGNDIQFSLKENNNISSKDRKELLDTIEHLKGEFEVTKFPKADQKKLEKMTKELLKEYNSQADHDETFSAIDKLYQYMANGEDGHPAVWEDVYNRAYNVAQEIVKNAIVTDNYLYQEYKSLRDYLRNTPMKFNTQYDNVPTSYENFNEFRKMNMGRLKFTKDGISVDSVYQELSNLYPEFFNAEEQITSDAQLKQIVDVLNEIHPVEINPFDSQIEQVSMYLANDLTSRFFDIPQAKPTFADKAEQKVVRERIKGAKKVEAVREQRDEKIKKLIESQREKTKKQLDKIRQQRDEKVAKERAKRRDSLAKMSEKQKAKVLRARITRHASDLNRKLINPTDNQHIPFELRGAVAKLLECINLESNYTYDPESGSYKKNDEGLPTKRTQAFNDLKKVYADIASSVVVDPDLLGEYGLLNGVISLADKRIVDMTSSELDTVWQSIRAIEASVNTANRVFSEGKYATILEVSEALRAYNEGKISKTEFKGIIGKTNKLATLDMLTPETYLHYLGDAGDSIFRMMRDAQDKHIRIMKEVSDFTHKELKGVDVNSLENTIHTVKLGGEEVQLSTAQLMELYVLMKRDQAVEHILIGGILPDITKSKGIKLITKTKPTRNISVAEISAATSKLTDDQKKVADKLQRFVSTVLSEYGNEASMQVYNYEKFTEKNYWTIRTNRQEIQSDVDKDTAVTSVANKGMTKATKPHANTSVRIGSIFDTFATHSSDMATYAAWLGTSEDVNRIRNFVFWEDGVRKGTVKDILDTVHSTKGSQYLEKLLTDIAIGVKGTDNLNPFDKLIGSYKAASVGANLRVIIQQPTAILRALDMIDARYLTEGTVRPLKGWEKAKKYAPIAQWKDWGYFDINTGRQMKDVLFDNASLLEKTKQVGMWGASMADSLAWGQLWNAVEAETKANHKELEVGSEAYYETVSKRFTEIVDHTQVVDGILQRSQVMRSADNLTKMATSFMGEPTKQYNMAMSAYYDFKTSKGETRKNAAARLGRTALSLVVAGIVNACAQSLIDAARDDDKEKKYWERWLKAFVGDGDETKWYDTNLADTANPLNYVPFAKDVVSILRGYDVKRMDTEAITKLYNAIKNMYKVSTGMSKYTVKEASAQLFVEISRLFGLPVSNVKRDIKSLITTIAIESDNYLMQYRIEKAMLNINYAGNRKNFMDILFNAYCNDKEAYEFIYSDMVKNGYEVDNIKKGMETRMTKAEGVKKPTDLSKRYMTPETEKKYDSSLNRVKSSKVWKSANTTQRKEAEADLYSFLTSSSEAIEKTRAEARAFGVDETEYTLWQLAKEMVNDDKDSMNAKEKAAAIEMLSMSDSELAYFYNTETADKAYANGIDMENFAMFKAAVSGLKGDNKKTMIENYAKKYARNSKEYLFFMGTEYSSYKKQREYIYYFGK